MLDASPCNTSCFFTQQQPHLVIYPRVLLFASLPAWWGKLMWYVQLNHNSHMVVSSVEAVPTLSSISLTLDTLTSLLLVDPQSQHQQHTSLRNKGADQNDFKLLRAIHTSC